MTVPINRPRNRTRLNSGREEAYATWDLTTAASRVAEGLPTAAIEMVQLRLALSNHEMAELVHISPRTLTRRRKETRLQPDESERVYRIGRLVEIATRVLGGGEAAREWFREPNFALGEQEPLELARTAPGAEIVERVLFQIEHGIPV